MPRRSAPLSRAWLALIWGAILVACVTAPPVATPPPTVSRLDAADALLAAGSYTAAEVTYKQAMANAPTDPVPALKLADLYLDWSRPADGLTALAEATSRGAPAVEIQMRRLRLLMLAGQWTEVVDLAESLLLAPTDTPDVTEALIRANLNLGRCAEATTAAQELVDTLPDHADAARTFAALRGAYGDLVDVAPTLMLGIEDCSATCDRVVGLRLARVEEWGLAACILDRAVSAVPDDVEVQVWLGEAHARLGRQADAYRHLRLAVELDPESAQAWLILGKNLLAAGDAEQARIALLNAQKLDPLNPAPCLAVAELKARMGLYDEIDRWTQAALDRASEDAEVSKAVARFYLIRRLANNALVLGAAERAVEQAPQDAEAHMLVGWTRFLRGDLDAAVEALDRAVALAPALAEAHQWRGRALDVVGRTREAEDALLLAADLGYRARAP